MAEQKLRIFMDDTEIFLYGEESTHPFETGSWKINNFCNYCLVNILSETLNVDIILKQILPRLLK